MKTLKIHLIRHGSTDANILGQYIGWRTDMPISPEGLTQLKYLKENFEYPDIECLYSSPLLRCRQTASVLYPGVGMVLADDLKEYDFGVFEGKTAGELENDPDFTAWASGQLSSPPDGEDNSDFIKRICLAFNQIVLDMTKNGRSGAAVIMHGGAIMMLLAACAVPRKKPVEWTCEPGTGYSLLVTPSLYFKSGVVEVINTLPSYPGE